MEITLAPELEAFVQTKVQSGQYADASDIIREALLKLEIFDGEESPELEALLLEGLEGPFEPLTMELIEEIKHEVRQTP